MIKKLQLLSRYIQFRIKAGNAYSIHSPFVYSLYTEALRQNRLRKPDEKIILIEKLANTTFKNNEPYNSADTGEKSTTGMVQTVGQKAKAISQSKNGGRLLHRLTNLIQPRNIIELGTGAGIGTLYMAASCPETEIITIEGNPAMADVARGVINKSGFSNISLLEGLFADVLPRALEQIKQAHMVFIDGDHRSESLIKYYETIKPYLHDKSVLVLHDIYWSGDMLNAWKQLISYPEVYISVDVFHMGLLFFSKEQAKQHFQLRV